MLANFGCNRVNPTHFYCVLYLADPLGNFTLYGCTTSTLKGKLETIGVYLAQKPS